MRVLVAQLLGSGGVVLPGEFDDVLIDEFGCGR